MDAKLPEIFCPECQNKLTPELVGLLVHGKTVYCELCGFPFYAIEAGEVKPLEKKENYNYTQKNLTKEEIQWIKWKKEWKRIKASLSTSFSSLFGTAAQTPPKSPEKAPVHLKPRSDAKDIPKGGVGIRHQDQAPNLSADHHPVDLTPRDQKNYEGLQTAKNILVDLSPFYYVFIVLITFFTALRRLSWFGLLSVLIIEFFIVIYDHREFLPNEREQRVRHAGIPMILFGLFSLSANGIGVFLLARGILNLLMFILEAKAISETHPAISQNPVINLIWIREIIYSFLPYLFQIFIVYLSAAVLRDMGRAILTSTAWGNFLYSLFMGGIIVVVIHRIVLPDLKSKALKDIPMEKSIILVVCGLLIINTGAGFYLLLAGILILVLQNLMQQRGETLPEVGDIRDIANSLAMPQAYRHATQTETESLTTEKTKRVPRFDPQTGEPLTKGKRQPLQPAEPIALKTKNASLPKITQANVRSVPEPGEITGLIFTVLEPEIREKLLDLAISQEEKDAIAKSMIYLVPEEQQRYLNELVQVNIPYQDYYSKYINRISRLSIDADQQEFLIKQLNFIPDEELEEFVKVLEENINNPK